MRKIPNIHPGEILLEEFIKPFNLSQNQLAKALCVPPRRINEIVLKKRAITPDTSIRLGKYFELSEDFFLNLQNRFDLNQKSFELKNILRNIPTITKKTVSCH